MISIAFGLLLAAAPAPTPACDIPVAIRKNLLVQDWETFDQSPQGFRALVDDKLHCQRAAGEIIAAYLDVHPELSVKQRYVSEFHAGQMFAGADDTRRALRHFYRGFNPDEDPHGSGKWNAYVRATIAFLEKDRPTLEASLAVLEQHQDNRMNAINIRLVKGFVAEFGASYAAAVNAAWPEDD
ncbi:MAG TPA: hypothetical protein VF267_00340 [Gammaproteobacteria bacterium]